MRGTSGRRRIPAIVMAGACAISLATPAAAQSAGTAAIEAALPMAMSTRPMPDGLVEKARAFLAALRPEALARGVSAGLYDRVTGDFAPDAEILDLLVNQPEHVAAPWDYMARLVSERRIEDGRQKLAEHAALAEAIEARYGVDRHVVLAVWGVESSYGASTGARDVIRSLATLAVGDPRRPQFWRGELLAALTILQRGDITAERMTGSWAGAMGHTQFMPSSYLAHAADFDGDGRRDIWGSIPDALASTAAYLKKAGWRSDEPWGFEVVLPAGFDVSLARTDLSKTAREWAALGVTRPFGAELPATAAATQLVLPAGVRGPAFLVGGNFRAILKYNNAVAYALAVGHLADRLRGEATIAGLWPTDDPPLDRAGREELQQRLAGLGHDPGAVDGVIGGQTRNAIRAAQAKLGLPPDGYAGRSLLARLRGSSDR